MRAVCLGSSHLVSRWRFRAAWRVEAASRRRNRWQYWPIFLIISGGHSKSGGVIFVKEITPHAHMDKMVLFFYRCHDEQEGLARLWVSRASRRPRIQWTHAVCARTRQLVAAPPPASACPPRGHCLTTAILHDLCFSPASPAEQTGTRHDKPGASYTGKSSKTGMAPHDKHESIARWHRKQAGVVWHDNKTRAAAGYGFGSTSARTPASATPR